MFPLKHRRNDNLHATYKVDCSCSSSFILEAKRNAEFRWNEDYNPAKSPEQWQDLYFTLVVILNAPKIIGPGEI